VKILFLCGSVEQGKDGVGDYATVLAAECGRLGHESCFLSLNDPWIRGSQRQETIQRLSSQLSWPERIKTARDFLAAIRPDLVSLQYVPYSFHPAGLNFALPQILIAILGRLPVQIMFHEIWTGAEIGAPAKVRFFGFCQRKTIEITVKKLSCQVIHTSNPVYRHLLDERRIKTELLPLFGSVPIVSRESWVPPGDTILRIAMFGSIHPEWSPNKLFSELRKLERLIEVSHIGRIGPGERIWLEMVEKFSSQAQFRLLGEHPPQNISRFLLAADLGLATTPLFLVGKSSTVAAMLEHGLPVVVTRDDIRFKGITDREIVGDDLLISFDSRFLERVRTVKKRPPTSRLPGVAAKFLADVGAFR
jgi:hypothetical protein